MFSGNVPFESFSLPSLKMLDLSNNQLVGQIDVQTFLQLSNLTVHLIILVVNRRWIHCSQASQTFDFSISHTAVSLLQQRMPIIMSTLVLEYYIWPLAS